MPKLTWWQCRGELPEGFQLKPHADLTLDSLRSFLKDFAAELPAADWIVRIRSSHEKARYLLVYDILKVFLLFGRGRRLHLEQASVADIEESEKDLYVAFEERLGAESVSLSGPVEFVITHGQNRGPIQMCIVLVVEVKKNLSPQTHTDEATWQFFAELLAACRYNLGVNKQEEAEVYGCLTDAYIWYCFRATRNQTGWSISAAEDVILSQIGARATNTTAAAINLFFSALIPDMIDPIPDEVATARQNCDATLSKRANRYTEEALNVMNLKTELAKRDQELAKRDEQIALLQQAQSQKQQ